MSRTAGDALPPAIRRLLDGGDLEGVVGLTVLLLTVDEAGWPRVAMLSAGELVATGPREVRVALWADGAAAANLGRTRRARLALVHDGGGWYASCAVRRGPDLRLVDGRRLAASALAVEEVAEDAVPYAELVHGIEFRLADTLRTLTGWRAVVAALRGQSQTGVW
jgi:hypothetical protein